MQVRRRRYVPPTPRFRDIAPRGSRSTSPAYRGGGAADPQSPRQAASNRQSDCRRLRMECLETWKAGSPTASCSLHRVHKCNLVHFRGDVRKDLRDILSALSVLLEFEDTRHDRTRPAVVDTDIAGQNLARVFFHRRLVLKGFHLADPAGIEDRDDSFRARLEMRSLWRKGVTADRGRRTSVDWRLRKQLLIEEHLSEGEPTDAAAGLKQKIAPRPEIFHFDYLVYKNSLRFSMTFVKST